MEALEMMIASWRGLDVNQVLKKKLKSRAIALDFQTIMRSLSTD
jgi:hypothetical protein